MHRDSDIEKGISVIKIFTNQRKKDKTENLILFSHRRSLRLAVNGDKFSTAL